MEAAVDEDQPDRAEAEAERSCHPLTAVVDEERDISETVIADEGSCPRYAGR